MGETKTATEGHYFYERGPFTVQVFGDLADVEAIGEDYLRRNKFFGESFKRSFTGSLPLAVIGPVDPEKVIYRKESGDLEPTLVSQFHRHSNGEALRVAPLFNAVQLVLDYVT